MSTIKGGNRLVPMRDLYREFAELMEKVAEAAQRVIGTIPWTARAVATATGAMWAVDEVNEWEAQAAAFQDAIGKIPQELPE